MTSPQSAVRWVLDWPVESQLRARRNALVASTALAQVRRERDEVEEYLHLLARRRMPAEESATETAHGGQRSVAAGRRRRAVQA